MKGDINLKLNKKAALGIIAAMGVYAMADYVSLVDVKSSGGITVTGGITESDLTAAIDAVKADYDAQIADLVAGELPIGSITLWSNSTPPTGWVEMRGQSSASYPELATIVGSTIPDMRGKFARGWSNDSTVDQNRGLASSQSDAIRNITGSFASDMNSSVWLDITTASGSFFASGWATNTMKPSSGFTSTGGTNVLSFDASKQVPTADENRPVNVALMYIIKAE